MQLTARPTPMEMRALAQEFRKAMGVILTRLDLFGCEIEPSAIDLLVFCDERKITNPQLSPPEGWTYICLILIPNRRFDEALQKLQDARDKHGYAHELAFRKVEKPSRKSEITAVAKDWITLVLNDTNIFYWNILGIARHNLNFICFGPGDDPTGKYANVYNRFFRAAFLGAVNSFFKGYQKVNIMNVFHDSEGNLQTHDYFGWHLPWKTSNNQISFGCPDITFVSSDHEEEPVHPQASQVIQLADLLVGAVSQCLDYRSTQPGKIEVAEVVCPILYSMMNKPYGKDMVPRTRSISFFPSKRLSNDEVTDELLRATSTFFYKRRILMSEMRAGQMALPGFG